MNHFELGTIANFIRAMSLKIEVNAFKSKSEQEEASRDLLDIAAKLCEAADALESPKSDFSFDAFSESKAHDNEQEPPEAHVDQKVRSKLH